MGDADTRSPEKHSDASPLTAEETTKKLKLTEAEEETPNPPAVPMEEDNSNDKKDTDDNNTSKEPDPPEEAKEQEAPDPGPKFTVQVMYNKNPLQLEISEGMTVLQLKNLIKDRVGVDVHLQKVLLKGIAKDEALLGSLGVSENTKKILVIGSSIQDVLKVKEVPTQEEKDKEGSSASSSGANWCSLPNHKKVIDKVKSS